MAYLGEILSLLVSVLWTVTALFGNEASRRLGAQPLNLIRMLLTFVMIAVLLLVTTGYPYPVYADRRTWFFLFLSGLVGFVFGDFCLFNAYNIIGARFGQLFMTIAPPTAAILGWLFLGEKMSAVAWIAMLVTLSGIGLSIIGRDSRDKLVLKLPLKGILLGVGAGVGQGGGLVLSKLGINAYEACVPTDAPQIVFTMLPFASTMIRVIAGAIGFALILKFCCMPGTFGASLHNCKGLSMAFFATFFGPFVGVSLSLMAVQYAKAGIASTLMALTPVFIIWPYSVIYKLKVSRKEIVGIIVAMAGVALFFLG